MRRLARWIAAACGLGLTLGGAPATAQSLSRLATAQSAAALDVPYLPQSELLCGGAAVAMVERWWGRRGVYAEDFDGLVHPELRGILTTDLVAAARARGWETDAFDGTRDQVREQLEQRVPVIALIQVAPARFHYIVVLAWSDGHVIFHDPARGPSRSIGEAEFLTQWTGADRWAMVLRPATQSPQVAAADSLQAIPPDSLSCRPWLDKALDAVAADRLDDGYDLLLQARRACPDQSVVLRELAGVRFKQRRFAEAIRLAEEYVSLAPHDRLGWQLLAASRYLSGDREGALHDWNQVGAPTVDLVRIDGSRSVPFRMIAKAIEVRHGTVLTTGRMALARRRVADLPALGRASVDYQPVGGGLVELHAVVAERPMIPRGWPLIAGGALRAITQHEVGIAIATPTGAGELWTAAWGWEHAHPRARVRMDMPITLGTSGILGIEADWDRFRFGLDSASGGSYEETRRAGTVGFGWWATPALRPSAGLRIERWSGSRDYLVAGAGGEILTASDRLTLTTRAEYGAALGPEASYTRGNLRVLWASSTGLRRTTWSARVGVDLVSSRSPVGLWPMASGDLSWAVPLRAHPRTSDGLLPGGTTGRSMMHGGLSGDHPFYRAGTFTLAAGIFLDGAEIMNPADGSNRNRLYLDTGAGLRLAILDGQLGTLRVDLATGLTDRRTAVTVGMHQSWPPF